MNEQNNHNYSDKHLNEHNCANCKNENLQNFSNI